MNFYANKLEYRVNFSEKYMMYVLQEGGPLPGPETGLLSNTWK